MDVRKQKTQYFESQKVKSEVRGSGYTEPKSKDIKKFSVRISVSNIQRFPTKRQLHSGH